MSTAPKPCPICGKPSIDRYKPFCSARCTHLDLHKWLGGGYVVETDEPPEDEMPSRDEE